MDVELESLNLAWKFVIMMQFQSLKYNFSKQYHPKSLIYGWNIDLELGSNEIPFDYPGISRDDNMSRDKI